MSDPPASVFEAAAAGDVAYLTSHAHLLGTTNDRKWTPLHFAARYGQTRAIEVLLTQSTVDKAAVNDEGKTAAQMAMFWGFEEAARLLGGVAKKEEERKGEGAVAVTRFPDVRRNYFSGNRLNRYGWARDNKDFLSHALISPNSNFILFANLNPLFEPSEKAIALIKYADIAEIAGNPFAESSESPKTDYETILVFLGIDETKGGDFSNGKDVCAFWTLDITPKDQATKAAMKKYEDAGFKFVETRSKAKVTDAAIIGQARAMIDWNSRNTFCPACGRRTFSSEAGYKRTCPPDQVPSDPVEAEKEQQGQKPPCISAKGIHNFSYPRIDPVVIACVIHPNQDKILLGRQKSWPAGVYSCLAGFVEAGETIEEAVRREVREESGIVVGSVVYHSSQPWPFPNSLMIGCIAEAVTDEVRLEDKELDSAGWFSRAEVVEALTGSKIVAFDSPSVGGGLRLPPETAIAHQLVKTWAVENEWGGEGQLNAKI